MQEELADQATFSQGFKQMTTDLIHPEKFSAPLPHQLQAQLRHYQEVGFRWLKMLSQYQFGGILADEMGIREDSSNNQLLVVRKAREATVECSDRCTCEFDV